MGWESRLILAHNKISSESAEDSVWSTFRKVIEHIARLKRCILLTRTLVNHKHGSGDKTFK
jgi:hypothetical protein